LLVAYCTYITIVGDEVSILVYAACSMVLFLGLCLVLVLFDYRVKTRVFGDAVVVVEVLVLFTEVMCVEFLYGVHIFPL
jgi:hypothetical protein